MNIGLFKGSTIELDKSHFITKYSVSPQVQPPNNHNLNSKYHNSYEQHLKPNKKIIKNQTNRPERPKSLQTFGGDTTHSMNFEKRTSTNTTYPSILFPQTVSLAANTMVASPIIVESSSGHENAVRPNVLFKSDDVKAKIPEHGNDNIDILSPFDEHGEWEKISEIMATFGKDIIRNSDRISKDNEHYGSNATGDSEKSHQTNTCVSNMYKNDVDGDDSGDDIKKLYNWLFVNGLDHLKKPLIQHGFDDIEFLVSTSVFCLLNK